MDKYYRILLRKKEDSELFKWLESNRGPGESTNKAVRRKLYELCRKDMKKV